MRRRAAAGVTLIELVVTIVLIGILASVAAIYIAPALEAYFASQRRAQMTDVADTAMRRMMREVRLALPNSARVDASGRFLEVLLTRTGGRYRAANDDDTPATTEIPLDFAQPITQFDVYETAAALGAIPPEQQVQAQDYVVIHNLGIPGANAYDTGAASRNIARVSTYAFGGGGVADENRITLQAATQFALESPGRRYFVVSGPVTYACVGTQLLRWSGYDIQLAQPTARPAGATEAVLADNVSTCDLQYTALPLVSRGLVAVRLAVTQANEAVTLYYEAHVNNVP
jgi:MSHA biogenesis protein MshO